MKALIVGASSNLPIFHLVLIGGESASLQVLLFANGGATATSTQVSTEVVPKLPEPATCSLIGLALAGGLGFARRRS